MSQFTFNLNGVAVDTAKLDQFAGSTKIGASLYSNTKDSDLTYTGSDSTVWDRINSERLRRGLPSLADIGSPRPADDATPAPAQYNSSDSGSNTETFTVKGPPGMTFEQAKAVFDQQVKSGGLVGFKVGDAVSAATQAADGLAAAQGQAIQGIGSALNKLPQGTDLQTLTSSVGPGLSGAINQAQSAFAGAGPSLDIMSARAGSAINSAVNATSVIGPGFAALSAQAPGALAELNAKIPGIASVMEGGWSNFTGQAAQIGTAANNAIKNISGALGGTPADGITVADFAKQGPALGDIGNLSKSMVTGTLAQANKLFGQGSSELTNSVGLGKFGLDAAQLEKTGFLKPGTAAQFLQGGEADLTAVLKSPLPWTGKDGIKGVNDLLGNSKLQDKIQQQLMSSGLGDLKQLGVPTDKLSPTALSGVSTLAAKNAAGAAALLTGASTTANFGPLTDKVKDVMSNSAFAVKLTEGKVEPPLKQEEPAPAATNTVNSDTVDAAGTRIVGNDKVPDVTTSGSSSSAEIAIMSYVDLLNETNAAFDSLAAKLSSLSGVNQITQDQWSTVNQEYIAIKATFNARYKGLGAAADQAIRSLPQTDPNYARLVNIYNGLSKLQALLKAQSETIKKIIDELASKITV